ncbi:carboxymuconolactone decarboxylase family protein [Nocardioides sp. LMS-CY]|uniref:carboxymuconolactone decarboxylase family protein n=1 Tax=Nocardioides sp. (strain LMS-CY) TaxID=2840457 RepID=UPI001BFFE09E|nr:carboxymuconolactone decarboxylase family protein [Nocardioides sp. LMS-CY]QWF20498.1 carboxymuconolactone decarboxylase family protein [Nocardioides sp. LMS-CY]
MALIPLKTKEQVDPVDLPLLESGEAAFGTLLNTWLAIAASPGMLSTYLPFVRSVSGPGHLDQRIKELTAVYVAVLNHCRYTTSHRCYSAQAKGITADDLARVASGKHDDFTDRERLGLELTRSLTVDVPVVGIATSTTGVDPQLLARVKSAFEPAELVELTMSVSLWNALSRFHRVMGLELDLGEPPAAVDAAV